MEQRAQHHGSKARTASEIAVPTHWARSLGVGAGLLLAALVAARWSSWWIGVTYPTRPMPPDLMFETLPYVPWLEYATDLVLIASLVLLGVYALRGNQREIPTMMALFGIMEIARAFITMLTPLAGPLGNGAYYGLIHAVQNGEFPSGHVASVLLCMLLVDRAKAPRIRTALAVLVVAECVTLLMSHGHYSIDVVGGLLLTYFVYHVWTEGAFFGWLKRLVTV